MHFNCDHISFHYMILTVILLAVFCYIYEVIIMNLLDSASFFSITVRRVNLSDAYLHLEFQSHMFRIRIAELDPFATKYPSR